MNSRNIMFGLLAATLLTTNSFALECYHCKGEVNTIHHNENAIVSDGNQIYAYVFDCEYICNCAYPWKVVDCVTISLKPPYVCSYVTSKCEKFHYDDKSKNVWKTTNTKMFSGETYESFVKASLSCIELLKNAAIECEKVREGDNLETLGFTRVSKTEYQKRFKIFTVTKDITFSFPEIVFTNNKRERITDATDFARIICNAMMTFGEKMGKVKPGWEKK